MMLATPNERILPKDDYDGLEIVNSFQELLDYAFGDPSDNPVNVVACPRTLTEDFNALAQAILLSADPEHRIEIKEYALRECSGSPDEDSARDQILADYALLQEWGRKTSLYWEGAEYGTASFHPDYKETDEHESRLIIPYNIASTLYLPRDNYTFHNGFLDLNMERTPFHFQCADITRHRVIPRYSREDSDPAIHARPETAYSRNRLVLIAEK